MSVFSEPVLHALLTTCDVGMLVFGGAAVWYLGYDIFDPRRRWAFVFGLCSQPFWAGKAVLNGDWYLLVVTLMFTYSWLRGLKANWNH